MFCNVYAVPTEKTSPIFARAFARGCGGNLKVEYTAGDWAGFGSKQNWSGLQSAIKHGYTWYYGDHGYFNRYVYFRITKNAYFHSGEGQSNGKRLEMFHTRPRKWVHGKNIIICPQSDEFYVLKGTTKERWMNETLGILAKNTDRPIRIHGKWDRLPLRELLKDAHATVVFTSNAALESICEGVPAFSTHPSHCSKMSLSDLSKIETPYYPEQDEIMNWLGVLADNQWNLEEINSGIAWRALNDSI